jgi:hypothetical protein
LQVAACRRAGVSGTGQGCLGVSARGIVLVKVARNNDTILADRTGEHTIASEGVAMYCGAAQRQPPRP